MGWEWDAKQKGDIIKYVFYSGSDDSLYEYGFIKFTYNIKTDKISNFILYDYTKEYKRRYDKYAANSLFQKRMIKKINDLISIKGKGFRQLKKFKIILSTSVNNFINSFSYLISEYEYDKMYEANGVKFKHVLLKNLKI